LAGAVVQHGGIIKAYPGLRPDGVRGLLTPTPLRQNDVILCIPKEYVMHLDVSRESVRKGIDEVLHKSGMARSEAEKTVYEQMMALCIELLLERHLIASSNNATATVSDESPDPSYWRAYVTSLPDPPSTINLYTESDRKLYNTLLGQDHIKMYAGLISIIHAATQQVPDFTTNGGSPPTRKAVQDEFFFILSRLSYLRLIPYIDLANAAPPGEHNVKIMQDKVSGNCYLHALRDIAPGEELCIDYNHRNGISLMASYGFSMELEKLRSSFKVTIPCPHFMRR